MKQKKILTKQSESLKMKSGLTTTFANFVPQVQYSKSPKI